MYFLIFGISRHWVLIPIFQLAIQGTHVLLGKNITFVASLNDVQLFCLV
jgi:hypothetical protein